MAEKITFGSFIEAARQYITSHSTIAAHKEKQDAARSFLLTLQQESGEKVHEEDGYKSTVSRIEKTALNSEKLKQINPELYQKCSTTTISYRAWLKLPDLESPAIKSLIEQGILKVETHFDEEILKAKLEAEEVKPEEISDAVDTKIEWRLTVKNGR